MAIITKRRQTAMYRKAKKGYEMTLNGGNYKNTPNSSVKEG